MKNSQQTFRCIFNSCFRFNPVILTGFLVITLLLPACAGPPSEPPLPGPAQPEPPQAGFDASVTSGQAPLTVTYSNTSRNADEFQWDFGDGATATSTTISEAPSHEYTKAGTHVVTLTAVKKGEPPQTSTATLTITVKPGALHAVTVPPIEIEAGEAKQLEAVATDQYGNHISEVDVTWVLTNENAGSLTEAGLLTAGEVAGAFGELEVKVTQGELARTATASVTVTPGALEQVLIGPNPAEIGMEMTQQFVAVGADKYGNRISHLAFTWSVDNGGTIDANGLFTAGNTPGTYADTVKAEATQGNITIPGTASVAVEPDRITFISILNDNQRDIYVMDVDGSNVERLTNTPVRERRCSWSPDGRCLVYDSYSTRAGILVMNDDGSHAIRLIANEKEVAYLYPAWSPNGSKIAFIKARVVKGGEEIDNLDIYIMDVDGGNVTQITDTSDGNEWMPAWSPDGTKIAYSFGSKDDPRDIYVINADGTGRKNLTIHWADDQMPVWSPDGDQIAFVSNRTGPADIHIMNADGSNQKWFTGGPLFDPAWSPDGKKIVCHHQSKFVMIDVDSREKASMFCGDWCGADSRCPSWAPRKRGVEVMESSVIIPEASIPKAMTVQDVTAGATESVVRIKTDKGTGSGFIIDPNGVLLTNNHVIRDAKEITVYLEDGTSYDGAIEARDLVRDLAVIKILAPKLPYLELGDLSQAGLGQQVVVLGYPLQSKSVSVTSGLISGIDFDGGRNITLIRTDSAINPGNSGGPMLNLQGQVIGVVSAKMVGFGIEGVGFAISANTVNTYLPRLRAGETIMTFD